jgi:anti-sigma factor RsiW
MTATPALEVWLLAILVVANCLARYFHDLHRYSERRASTWEPLIRRVIQRSAGERMAAVESTELSRITWPPPAGVPGLSRGLLVFSLLAVLAFTVAVSVASGTSGTSELETSVSTGLLATVATVVGLYCGGKAAEPAPALR